MTARDRKPSALQARILRALQEDACRIRLSALKCVLIDDKGYFVLIVTGYTFRSIIKQGWIEQDPEDLHQWRISPRGILAIQPQSKGAKA